MAGRRPLGRRGSLQATMMQAQGLLGTIQLDGGYADLLPVAKIAKAACKPEKDDGAMERIVLKVLSAFLTRLIAAGTERGGIFLPLKPGRIPKPKLKPGKPPTKKVK